VPSQVQSCENAYSYRGSRARRQHTGQLADYHPGLGSAFSYLRIVASCLQALSQPSGQIPWAKVGRPYSMVRGVLRAGQGWRRTVHIRDQEAARTIRYVKSHHVAFDIPTAPSRPVLVNQGDCQVLSSESIPGSCTLTTPSTTMLFMRQERHTTSLSSFNTDSTCPRLLSALRTPNCTDEDARRLHPFSPRIRSENKMALSKMSLTECRIACQPSIPVLRRSSMSWRCGVASLQT
jgi:hypothetical protein